MQYKNTKQGAQPETKTIQEAIGYLNKVNSYTLEHKLVISPDGEYLRFGNAKEALDALKHIEKSMRMRGFGVYALHNCLWLVPFIHQDVYLPNFQRAIKVLPDHSAELSKKLLENNLQHQLDPWQTSAQENAGMSFNWKKHKKWLIGSLIALIFICFVI